MIDSSLRFTVKLRRVLNEQKWTESIQIKRSFNKEESGKKSPELKAVSLLNLYKEHGRKESNHTSAGVRSKW